MPMNTEPLSFNIIKKKIPENTTLKAYLLSPGSFQNFFCSTKFLTNRKKNLRHQNTVNGDIILPLSKSKNCFLNVTSDVRFNLRQCSLACSSAFNLSLCLLYNILGLLIKWKSS